MTKEKLFETLSDIDDELVEEAENYKKRNVFATFKWGLCAACFVILLMVGIAELLREPKVYERPIIGTQDDVYINQNFSPVYEKVTIGERQAIYEMISDKQNEISEQKGKEFQRTDEVMWFYKKDTKTLQYLIKQDEEGNLSLWKFKYFIIDDEEWGAQCVTIKEIVAKYCIKCLELHEGIWKGGRG